MKKSKKALLYTILGAMALVGCDRLPDTSSSSSTTGSNNTSVSSSTSSVLTGDALILDELLARVIIPENNKEIVNNFDLPATVKYENYVGDIVWTADSDYLIIDTNKTNVTDSASGASYDVYKAVIVRPEAGSGDETVRLTATVTYNGLTGTKQQKITIPEAVAGNTADHWGTFSTDLESLKISTWEEWRAQETGNIAVKGIITGMIYQATYSNANVFLQDEDGGYYAYAVGEMSEDEANNYLAVGNEVIFEGEKSIYNGLHEFNQEKTKGIEVLSRGNTFEATDVTEAATAGNLNRYQAMWVEATGMFVTSGGKKYLQFGDNKYEIYHSEKYSGSYYATVTEQMAGLNPGDMVDVTGMVGCYNADQFHPYNMAKSDVQVELTDEQKLQFAKDGVNTNFNSYTGKTLDANTEISLYQSQDDSVSLTYSLNDDVDTSVFNLSADKLTVTPSNEEKTATLSVKVAVGSLEETLTFNFKAQLPSGDEINYVIDGSMPSGLTYITNNEAYPNPEFYSNGGLKLNYVNQGVQTSTFEAKDKVTVALNIKALNSNTKTTNGQDTFTIYGLDANETVVATTTLNELVTGEKNTVVLTSDSANITSVKIMFTNWYFSGETGHNISLGGVKLNFGEVVDTPVDPDTPDTPDTPAGDIDTIASALQAAEGTPVVLEGKVVEIYEAWSDQYENISFYIQDDAGSKILVYRGKGANVTINDIVRVEGKVTIFNNVAQIAAGSKVEILEEGVYEDPTATAAASLDFSSTANRTSLDTATQVWKSNGITFTNEKGSSTSNVADYSAPVRCYKSSNIRVEYTEEMNKVVFMTVSNYTFPATFTIEGATMTIDGTTVTFTLDTPSTSFEINGLPNQIRFNSLAVYTA